MSHLTSDAKVTLREVTAETVREISALSDSLSAAHRRMVAPNAISIAEAYFSEHAWFRAIYADETPVGFAMLYIGPGDPPEEDQTIYYLWRFMIGAQFHGKGYGRKALEIIIDTVKSMGATELRLSCGEGEGSPEEFYRWIGFERDGQMYDDEVGMRMVFQSNKAEERSDEPSDPQTPVEATRPEKRSDGPSGPQPAASQLLHFSDPNCREFEADIIEQFELEGGRFGVVLEHTYFYPTGGGQEHDLGTLGGRQVVDVYKDEARGRTVHVVDGALPAGRVLGVIDAERRRRHMQHHTAQHLLSGCFAELFGLETLSANINGDSPSTLDLDGPEPVRDALRQVEMRANRIVWEDRQVSTYFAAPDKLAEIPLRKPPKVSEDIRIVEIAGLDWSACGGTHVATTGGIGVVKIVRTEKVKDKTRIHFVAGERALELFQLTHEIAGGLAAELTVGLPEVPAAVARLAENGKTAQRELTRLQAELLAVEAARLYAEAEDHNGRRLIRAVFSGRTMNDLRALGRELLGQAGTVAVLASEDAGRVSLVTACAADSGVKAGDLLRRLLPSISGKGGGDATLAQGGGMASPDGLAELMDAARGVIVEEKSP